MNLKQLLRKVNNLKSEISIAGDSVDKAELEGIKQTVQAVDFDVKIDIILTEDKVRYELWEEIKRALSLSTHSSKKSQDKDYPNRPSAFTSG